MKFCKYHALGNDFVLFEEDKKTNFAFLAKRLCRRRTGIGADGLIVIDFSCPLPKITFFNADGSAAKVCGNGLRCAAHFCFQKDRTKILLKFFTADGEKQAEILSSEPFLCKTDLGVPRFCGQCSDLPKKNYWGKSLSDGSPPLFCVFSGAPHTVVFCNQNSTLAKKIQNSQIFPDKCNVDFVKVVDQNTITCSTFERGVGRTHCCGTGAAACAVVANALNKCKNEVEVRFGLGSLAVEIADGHVFVTGTATKVYDGNLW